MKNLPGADRPHALNHRDGEDWLLASLPAAWSGRKVAQHEVLGRRSPGLRPGTRSIRGLVPETSANPLTLRQKYPLPVLHPPACGDL